jgi:hypothetical protein
MHHDHRQQFGVDLTQDPPWLLAAPRVHLPLAFPQLEEEFNLPARTQQDEGFVQRQHVSGDRGNGDRPRSERQRPCGRRLAFVSKRSSQAPSSLVSHFLGDANSQQPDGELLMDADGDGLIKRRTCLMEQDEQITAVPCQ